MLPFLRGYGPWWKVGIGFFWIPAIIVVITVESFLHVSQGLMWLSLGVLFVGFIAYLIFWDNRPSQS